MKLSKRLEKIAEFLPVHGRIADLGSDHAYLPISQIQAGKISFAVAGEVARGPFNNARQQVELAGLTGQIKVRLADGFEAIKRADQIDTVVIAGMGGKLITSILERGRINSKLDGVKNLILQPNVGEKNVRKWLFLSGYEIVNEAILEESGTIYEIIIAKFSDKKNKKWYAEGELIFGKFLKEERSVIFRQKWHNELANLQRIIAQLDPEKNLAKIMELQRKEKLIIEVLNESN